MKRIAITVAPFLLSACGEMSPTEQAKMEALNACSERSEALFSGMSDGSYELRFGEPKADNFRSGKDGYFVLEVPDLGPGAKSQFLWTCSGNLKSHVINLIEFDGIAKRPTGGQVWSF